MTCAFAPCQAAVACALEGGCVALRFPKRVAHGDDLKKGSRKLAGDKPARTNRDPALIKRRRKPL